MAIILPEFIRWGGVAWDFSTAVIGQSRRTLGDLVTYVWNTIGGTIVDVIQALSNGVSWVVNISEGAMSVIGALLGGTGAAVGIPGGAVAIIERIMSALANLSEMFIALCRI